MRATAPIAALALLGCCLPLAAQTPPQPVEAAAELAGIRTALEEIAELLRLEASGRREQMELARLELAVATLDLRTRAATALEARAADVRQRLEATETELFRMRSTADAVRDEAAEAEAAGDAARVSDIRRVQAQLEANAGLLEDRLAALETEALDLGNELARARRGIEDLEARVATALDLD